MALSNSQYESIMRVYNRTQLQKKHELDARVDEVYEKIPAIRRTIWRCSIIVRTVRIPGTKTA